MKNKLIPAVKWMNRILELSDNGFKATSIKMTQAIKSYLETNEK